MKELATVLNAFFIIGLLITVPVLGGGGIIILIILYGVFYTVANIAWAEIGPKPKKRKFH